MVTLGPPSAFDPARILAPNRWLTCENRGELAERPITLWLKGPAVATKGRRRGRRRPRRPAAGRADDPAARASTRAPRCRRRPRRCRGRVRRPAAATAAEGRPG